jgi:hypothetical protein
MPPAIVPMPGTVFISEAMPADYDPKHPPLVAPGLTESGPAAAGRFDLQRDGHPGSGVAGVDVGALSLGWQSAQGQESGHNGRYSGSSAHCPSLTLLKLREPSNAVGVSAPDRRGRATSVPLVLNLSAARGKSFKTCNF